MPPSYRLINYHLRIAKSIERKIFVDLFIKLSKFHKIDEYQYIGMGATTFSDFTLFHKNLGISDMTSIEKEKDDQLRFEFNKPYSCITMNYGECQDVLPRLNWVKPSITWLDYDEKLNSSMLKDIHTIVRNAISGNFFIISVNAHPDSANNDTENGVSNSRLSQLEERVGKDKIPPGTKDVNLSLAQLHKTYRDIIINEINSILIKKNGILHESKKQSFLQVVNFTYEDGVKMLTIGGLFYSQEDAHRIEESKIRKFDFFRDSRESFNILVPSLTLKEIKHIDEALPGITFKEVATGFKISGFENPSKLPAKEIKTYSELYRYFPTFAEAII